MSTFFNSKVRLNRMSRNWLCLARLSPVTAGLVPLATVPFPAGEVQIGFVWRNRPGRRFRPSAPIPVRVGKLASFDAPDKSPDLPIRSRVLAQKPRSKPDSGTFVVGVSFVQPGPAPASPPTSPVRVRSCRSGRIGFVSHAFVRSTALARIGPLLPAPRRYSERSKIASGISSPPGQVFDKGACQAAHDETLQSRGHLSVIRYSVAPLSYKCANSSSSEICAELTGAGCHQVPAPPIERGGTVQRLSLPVCSRRFLVCASAAFAWGLQSFTIPESLPRKRHAPWV